MDYKKKYLKYKLKYLQAKKTFKGGMEGINTICVYDVNSDVSMRVTFNPNNNIFESVAEAFGRHVDDIDEVGWGFDRFDSNSTFSGVGIEDGARISVIFKCIPPTVEDVAKDIIALNPAMGHTTKWLMETVSKDQDGNVTRINWGNKGLTEIPESLGYLTNVTDSISLYGNRLTTLPESIKNLKTMHVDLRYNELASVPTSIKTLKNVDIRHNPVSEQYT